MSLYKRGEWYWIDISSDSGRVREPAGTTDRQEAKAFHEKRKGEIWRQDKLGESPPVTWGEAVAKWVGVRKRSLPEKYLLRDLGITPSSSLPLSVQQIEKSLASYAAGSHNRRLNLIVAIHNTSSCSPPSIRRKPNPPGRTRWLTAEEWLRLRSALQDQSPLLCQCAAFTLATGLRENNVLELEWSQIDLRRSVAWLHGDQMKGKVPLGVPLNDAACAVLEARRGIHKRWVFGNPEHPLTKASNRAWYAALRKARLQGFRWHDLRHTWASWAVMSGVRLEELQRLGGWKTAQMVQRYAHLSSEHLAESAAKIKPVSVSGSSKKTRSRHKGA